MKQKIFLTSALAMGVFAPAFAEMTDSNTFPDASQGEYMQANTRYIGAATSDNMAGVYENNATVNAVAEYIDDLYTIVAGQYLPAGAESPIDCDQSGYFCAGVQNGVYYDANNNQGLTSCSDATNGAYTLSAGTGTSADSCFRSCDINNMGTSFANIPHAKTVSGNDYYGNGADTCEPTECFDGWHVRAAIPNLMSAIGVSEDGTGYTANNRFGNVAKSKNMPNSVISGDSMAFAVDYGNKGIIKGHGGCSSLGGSNGMWRNMGFTNSGDWTSTTTNSYISDETGGINCWCRLNSYTANGSNTEIALSGPWAFYYYFGGDGSGCASNCASNCASALSSAGDNSFRSAMFGAYPQALSPAMCEANVININWYNADAADITANNAGTATYGSDVRTPVKAQTIKGKTFKGWRFSKPEQTNLPE